MIDLLLSFYLVLFLRNFIYLRDRDRDRECVQVEGEAEGEGESPADSTLSTEPNSEFDLTAPGS